MGLARLSLFFHLVKEIKGNYKDKYRRMGGEQALKCDDCGGDQVQTQSHCLVCPHWDNIRGDLDLEKMDGMVTFFQRLLAERLQGKTGSRRRAAQQES